MVKLIERIKKSFQPVKPLEAGIYQYQSPPENPLNYRLHLRVEEGGQSGLLIINASTVLHLNQTATEYVYHIVKQTEMDEAISIIRSRYQASREQIEADFKELKVQIENLILTPDLEPVTFLDIERHVPYTDEISAPYRLDCALTYRVSDGTELDVEPQKRVDRELSTNEWKTIIDKSWQAGIPHIIFTGGEPTLREDLADLLQQAENNGQVTGLLTDGIKFKDSAYLKSLLDAGLDHTMVILQPSKEESWDSLTSFTYWSEIMEEDIFVAVHLTITQENKNNIHEIIQRLGTTGIAAISLSATSLDLKETLQEAQGLVYQQDLELIWELPVPYSGTNPIAVELDQDEEEERPSGAGRGWLYVEPDGDVLPGQGINDVLGNMLSESWETLWETAKQYKN